MHLIYPWSTSSFISSVELSTLVHGLLDITHHVESSLWDIIILSVYKIILGREGDCNILFSRVLSQKRASLAQPRKKQAVVKRSMRRITPVLTD